MMVRTIALVFLVLVAGCEPEEKPIPVVVGGKSTTEQRILGEAIAQLIESNGMVVERKFDLGGTAECDAAIRAGKIDVYVEYTGLALIMILRTPTSTSLLAAGWDVVLNRVRAEYEQAGLVWTAPFGFDNPYAIVVRGGTAGLTISESLAAARNWRAAFPFDFQQRVDFFPALKKVYGLTFAEVRAAPAGDQYKMLIDHTADAVVGNLTDGALAKLSLKALEDDKRALPSFRAAPVVRRAALDLHPGLEGILNGLVDSLDAPTMRKLNEEVDVSGKTPAVVAAAFLDSIALF